MKSIRMWMPVLFGMVIGAVIGCGGSSSSANADSGVSVAQFQQLTDTVNDLKSKFGQVKVFGQIKKSAAQNASNMRVTEAIAASFGLSGCNNIGLHVTNGGSDTANAMYSQYVGFQTCKGVYFNVSYADGTLDMPAHLMWDGPNCTGNMYVATETAQAGFSPAILNNGGVAFQLPGDPNTYSAGVGVTSTKVNIQSSISFLSGGGGCGPDVTQVAALPVVLNNVDDTGVMTAPYDTNIVLTSL